MRAQELRKLKIRHAKLGGERAGERHGAPLRPASLPALGGVNGSRKAVRGGAVRPVPCCCPLAACKINTVVTYGVAHREGSVSTDHPSLSEFTPSTLLE